MQPFDISVVNCFQKLLSSWHDTTFCAFVPFCFRLWIAFKNYYLRDTTQRVVWKSEIQISCELLSKIIIFVTRHNLLIINLFYKVVVNCFQKLLSSWHDTTNYLSICAACQLWIAFKNYYLRDTTQHRYAMLESYMCCELLSKIIIFVTRHNFERIKKRWFLVVNCFQKLLSSWHDTTSIFFNCWSSPLWIAFKNYYLRDTTQQNGKELCENARCELLSKIIIFVTRHNSLEYLEAPHLVVNCFQKLLSSWHDTTCPFVASMLQALWIAFKNYYLRDTTQHASFDEYTHRCCELLSKIIIFVTRHNLKDAEPETILVVNCFQKLLSSWHDTTNLSQQLNPL